MNLKFYLVYFGLAIFHLAFCAFEAKGQTKADEDDSKGGKMTLQERVKVMDDLRRKTKDIPLTEKEARDAIMTLFDRSQDEFWREEMQRLKDKTLVKRDEEGLYIFGRWYIDLKEKTIHGSVGDPKKYLLTQKGVFYFEEKTWKIVLRAFPGPTARPAKGK